MEHEWEKAEKQFNHLKNKPALVKIPTFNFLPLMGCFCENE